MQTFGFVGASGTGKSYRSLYVAQKHNIKYIIDDGLLIDAKRVIAGRSAKREQTKVASIKLFILGSSHPSPSNDLVPTIICIFPISNNFEIQFITSFLILSGILTST